MTRVAQKARPANVLPKTGTKHTYKDNTHIQAIDKAVQ